MPEMLDESKKTESTTIGVYRTAAVMKGGRRFSFGALVVVGDRNGKVGYGYAKSNEVPQAVEKAQKDGMKRLADVTRVGTTIHHEVEGSFGASKVRLIPASPGTGVVAGTVVRAVLELAGIADCLTKCYGSTNPQNVLKAVFDAISQLRTPDSIAALRKQELGQTVIQAKIEKGKAFMPSAKKGDRPKGPVNTVGSDRKGARGVPFGKGRRGRGGDSGGGGGGGGDAAAAASAPAAPAGGEPTAPSA